LTLRRPDPRTRPGARAARLRLRRGRPGRVGLHRRAGPMRRGHLRRRP